MKKILLAIFFCLVSSGAWAALSLDGAPVTSTTTSITISTSNTNDVIILFVKYTNSSVPAATVSSSHLSWTRRGYASTGGASDTDETIEEWYAIAAGTLSSEVISVTGPSGGQRNVVMAISGANTSTPFDSNVSLPGTTDQFTPSSPITITASTTNTHTILLSAIAFNTTGFTTLTQPSNPSSFNAVSGLGSFAGVGYLVVSSTISSASESYSWTGSPTAGVAYIFDAVQQASGAVNHGFTRFLY
jgi:hypothetical protein